jgi:hypothetical protein
MEAIITFILGLPRTPVNTPRTGSVFPATRGGFLMQLTKCAVAVLLAAPIFGSGGNPEAGLTVHEWGTFTTVADGNGGAEPWSPLGGASDLPCFVMHLHGLQYKSVQQIPNPVTDEKITVRMETPVLYFYAPRKTTLSVAVDFPKGLITEWYPKASKVAPSPQVTLPPVRDGRIEWNGLEVDPGATPVLPQGNGGSHYYAARNTDANPVHIGESAEKLLFYRGVANFSVPLRARSTSNGAVELRNTGDDPLALAVLFENRDGKIGYRMLRGVRGSNQVEAPALSASLDSLKHDLSDALVAQGLYRKEADAMIETWRDSWFEEGMRIFYLVPQALVNRELPLSIQPAPTRTARVFVGREEILSPHLRDRLTTALSTGDTTALDRFGRFLVPFLQQTKVNAAPSVATYLSAKSKQAEQEFYNPSCVR